MIKYGGLLGLLFFLLVFGISILNPDNIGWLLQDSNQDSVQHFVGWEFFRNEPWSFPPGIIRHYGFPISTSIVYVDAIPLFAFIFKLLSPYLHTNFQYFGFWFALCYFLQGMFAFCISGKISDNIWIKILITCFFILSPIMLNRTLEHQALVAQWLILAGILLYWQPYHARTPWYWLALNITALLIHAYLACMVLLIWLACIFKQVLIERALTKLTAVMQIIVNLVLLVCAGWLAGYFVISFSQDYQAIAYHLNSMNLIAPFFPGNGSPILKGHWSSFFTASVPVLSIAQEDEGFNYFGLGMLLLMLISGLYIIQSLIKQRSNFFTQKYWRKYTISPLVILSGGLFLYAISNEIALGPWLLFHYHLPSGIVIINDTFRAAGRFFWPVYYLTIICVFYFLNKRLSKRGFLCVLSIALVFQVADLSYKLNQMREHFTQPVSVNNELNSPLWQNIATHYDKIVFLPYTKYPHARIAHFKDYIHFAAIHGMKVNLGYFAREDLPMQFHQNKELLRKVMHGKLASDTVYVIIKPQTAAILKNRSTVADRKELIGRYLLIAPFNNDFNG